MATIGAVLVDLRKDGAVLAALSALAVLFALQVAAGPHLFDAGELIAASWELGGSHPPGQPLHALLAHAFARVPLGPIPARIALFSGACVLWAGWLACQLAAELARLLRAPERAVPFVQAVAALGVGLTTPVLRQALRAEVYGLSLALTLWSALHLTRWAAGGPGRHIAFAGFAAGLAATVHPLNALSAVLFGLAVAVPQARRLLARPRPVLWAAGFAPLGMLVYAYLPARAAAGAAMWGRPGDLDGFLTYVSGEAYAHNSVIGESVSWVSRAGEVTVHALVTGAGVGLLALLLLWLREPTRRTLLAGLALGGGLALTPSWLVLVDLRIPDHPGYFAPGCAIWIAAGAAALGSLWREARLRAAVGLALALLAVSPYTLSRAPELLRSDAPVLETLMGTLVDTPPPRALVVPTTDFTAGGWMMARTVDGARPDAAIFVAGLSTSSWHWQQLAAHPALDGTPRRGAGKNPHRQYLRGAIASALPHVPVLLERDLSGIPLAAIAGPYSVVARPSGGAPGNVLTRSIGERQQARLAQEAAASPAGDGDAVAAILRDQLSYRGRRLLGAGHTRAGMEALVDSLWPLSPARRTQLLALDAKLQPRRLSIPHVVPDSSSFLMSRGEALRTTATALWTAGRREQGMTLLEEQGRGGEPRALLQLAWLQLYDGQPDVARRTLDGILATAPELAEESRPLVQMLARIAAQPRP